MITTSAEGYPGLMAPIHAELAKAPALVRLLDAEIAPRLLHRFLIEYCALGVQLTEPVEGWILRAGKRCKAMGLDAVGDSLVKHAVHEAGHERLFMADAKALSALYQSRYGEAIDVEALLADRATPAMQRYISLHEETIAGPAPFAQVAIELEIEGLSVSVGPSLLKQIEGALGPAGLACCSFLTEHVAIDVGHTKLNEKMLGRLLAVKPEALQVLVDTGKQALEAYLGFLGECMDRAEEQVRHAVPAARASA